MENHFEEMFGPIVGHGAQATVYAKGDYAVKLYREGYPKRNVFSEAYIMINLEEEHFPSPKVYEVLHVGNRYGLRMDCVKGTLMQDILAGEAGNFAAFEKSMNELVDLQWRLQKQGKVGGWAPDIKYRFRDDLLRNERLTDEQRQTLLATLDALPDGDSLCHCDFHAGNVFFDGTDYTIIDLLQMSKGDPAADAICTYAAYTMGGSGIAEYYLERYCEVSGISKEDVLRWLPVYAGTLLGQVPEEVTPIIEGFLA